MTGAGEGGESVAAGSELPVKLSNSIWCVLAFGWKTVTNHRQSHGGGSCQFSLSYDGGENWMVSLAVFAASFNSKMFFRLYKATLVVARSLVNTRQVKAKGLVSVLLHSSGGQLKRQ